MTLVGHADGVEKQSNSAALTDLYQKYLKSTNASDREEMKLLLQRQLDSDPASLLSIPGLDASNICDGSDIDADSGIDTKMMLRKTTRRIAKVKSIAVKQEQKRMCLASLEKFKACIVAQGC